MNNQKNNQINFQYYYILILTVFLAFVIPEKTQAQLAKGADIGWLSQFESWSIEFLNDNGEVQDALEILKDHGFNAVRLRAMVNPSSDGMFVDEWGEWPMGFTSTDSVVSMAQRANNLGMDVMITIHYSDEWADPGDQNKPVAWEDLSFAQLETQVYDYTYALMDALLDGGVTPKWVQVGNEVNTGFLWPDGSTNNWPKAVQLFNSGYSAVKDRSPSTRVITHLASGNNNELFTGFFDNFFENGGLTDIIGLSYYPAWHGGVIGDAGSNMKSIAERYNIDVMLCEIGHYETNVQETYDLMVAAINEVESIPDNHGLGLFWWEPASSSSLTGYNLGAATQVSGNQYQMTSALDAFKDSSVDDRTQIVIENPGFETGELSPWVGNGSSGVTSNGFYSGLYSGWCGGLNASITQTITDLSPNSTYKFSCYVYNWTGDGGDVTVGVNNTGGISVSQAVGHSDPDWVLVELTFTTAGTTTSANIYMSTSDADTWGRMDDVSIVEVENDCTPTAIIPYQQIDSGSWEQASSAYISEGMSIKYGPQPLDESWSWSGPNGFYATTREVHLTNLTTNNTGDYVATYTNSLGCESTQIFSLVVNEVSDIPEYFNLSTPTGSVRYSTITYSWEEASGADTYTLIVADNAQFSYPLINKSGITESFYTAGGLTSNTTYYWKVIAVNSNGSKECNDIFSFTTRKYLKNTTANIEELAGNKIFKIYPNPVLDNVTINTETLKGETNLIIYNSDGRQILNKRLAPQTNGSFTLPVSQFSKGTYFLKIIDKTGVSTTKKLILK